MLATKDTIELLNSFLRGEIAATETYVQALAKCEGGPGHAPITKIRDEHREAANTWRQHIHQFGGDPDQDSGAWGAFAKAVEGSAKMFGKSAALTALKQGEERGLHDYEAALQKDDLPMECQSLIRSQLIPQGQEHIRMLDALMAQQ